MHVSTWVVRIKGCMGFQSPTWSREVLSTVLLMEAVPGLVFPQHVHSPSNGFKVPAAKANHLALIFQNSIGAYSFRHTIFVALVI